MRLIILLFILISCSVTHKRAINYNCQIIDKLLSVKQISNYIATFPPLIPIRLVDLTGKFKHSNCNFKETNSIIIENKLKFDINTGRYIDIVVERHEKISDDEVKFTIFFAIMKSGSKYSEIYYGDINIGLTEGEPHLKDEHLYILD